MVVIRLARCGRVHKPVYTVVAADSRCSVTGRFIEKLGQYNPNSKEVLLDMKEDRLSYWLSQGAKPSSTVASLLKQNKILVK